MLTAEFPLPLSIVMAGCADLVHRPGQLHAAVRRQAVAAITGVFSKWGMGIGTHQFRASRNVRVMAINTISFSQSIIPMLGAECWIKRMAGTTHLRWAILDQAGMIRAVGSMACITVACSHRIVDSLLAELLYQAVMAGVAEISRLLSQTRSAGNRQAVDRYALRPTGNELGFGSAVRIMAAAAVPLLGWSVNELLGQIQIRVVVAAFAQFPGGGG